MGIDRLELVRAFAAARWAAPRTRADIERRQAALWRRLAPTLAQTPALKPFAGAPLDRLPIVTPVDLRQHFDQWNSLGLDRKQAEAAAAAAERGEPGEVAPDVTAGFSTGSTGPRGVFLASGKERAGYLGQALAKLLPAGALARRWRIALILRANSALYRDVTQAGAFRFLFLPLDMPPDQRAGRLEAYAPDILIAPSHALADLARRAEAGVHSPPRVTRLFYGAEPMSEAERSWITGVLGARPDPIYQATEGFLGAACAHGTLHLNEDSLIVERTPVAGTDRFAPIVTDLRRTTQPMVRVQLDDLLHPLDAPCPCGSPLLAVHGVEGRVSDIWRWNEALFCPRDIEVAMSGALGASASWRAVANAKTVRLEAEATQARAGASALAVLLAAKGVAMPVTTAALPPQRDFKRRRVRWIDA